ncbi:MAG TPA: nucleotidyltransferase domain-containing protein [Rubrivivax sp.]|mgnify:FL=1|nr:nucleotidyltransferase domain-containing protein [Rubrivivax sp.]HRY89361.1 nucleotidyltransferase domain-containing protein [Rubrivivax sp.]HRZ61376.1 nucleotidyltransferase domain-containing protein [Rubrivivax sp.]
MTTPPSRSIELSEAMLNEITRRLVATYQPEQVVLFGSHAWGTPDENSDVDLLVVLSASDEPAYRRASAGYRSLFGVGVPCDVWVRTREEVLREAPLSTTLTHKIIREGRVLHG